MRAYKAYPCFPLMRRGGSTGPRRATGVPWRRLADRLRQRGDQRGQTRRVQTHLGRGVLDGGQAREDLVAVANGDPELRRVHGALRADELHVADGDLAAAFQVHLVEVHAVDELEPDPIGAHVPGGVHLPRHDVVGAVDHGPVGVVDLTELAEGDGLRCELHARHLEGLAHGAVAAGLELALEGGRDHLQHAVAAVDADVVHQRAAVRGETHGAHPTVAHLHLVQADDSAALDGEGVGPRGERIHLTLGDGHRAVLERGRALLEGLEPGLGQLGGERLARAVVLRRVDHDGAVTVVAVLVLAQDVEVGRHLDLLVLELDLGDQRRLVIALLHRRRGDVQLQRLERGLVLETVEVHTVGVQPHHVGEPAGRDVTLDGTDAIATEFGVANVHFSLPSSFHPPHRRV